MPRDASALPDWLTPLELAACVLLGDDPSARRSPRPPDGGSAVEAIEAAVVDAVRSPPCLVSFSGGIDSSIVLAAAVRVARREGAPDPVPITWRFADAPESEEGEWQAQVVRELGVGDWLRLDGGDELDFVGPVAQRVLRRYGLLYPANTHFHEPLLARARGGTLLTGIGGDQLLGPGRWPSVARLLGGHRPRNRTELLQPLLAASPVAVRRLRERRRPELDSPWMTSPAEARAARAYSEDRARQPLAWHRRVESELRRRELTVGLRCLDLLAAGAGAGILNPLLAPDVVAAIARTGGRRGFSSRREAVAAAFGELVPAAVRERRTKARFGEALWREPSRVLAANWDGRHADPAYVDIDRLATLWRARRPPPRTAFLLQYVWLCETNG